MSESSASTTGASFDSIVLGAGSAGYAAARTLAAAGRRVAVIEGGEAVGGLCILRGCMPTKTLLYAAEVAHLARQAPTWGVRAPEVGIDFSAVMTRKDSLIREFADYRRQQLEGGPFEFIRASAAFMDAHTVQLNTGRRLTADHFVICTGSRVAPPPLPDLAAPGCLTSDDALALERLPESLLVLGGGPIAVEFAQYFSRMGVRVTLIQRSGRILRGFDPDAAEVLEEALRAEGITLFTGTRLEGVRHEVERKVVRFVQEGVGREVAAESVLLALGRVPNTAALQLDRAGVATEQGRITTNERMQTTAAHVYAAGDCTSPHEIVHLAVQQGEIAAHNIAHPGQPRTLDYRLLLNVVFTEPQVASVGLTETVARERGLAPRVARHPFADHGKSLIMEARHGFVKLLADPVSGEILGGACVGPAGGELIHEIMVAMHARLTVHEFATLPHYHPTLAEIWTYPAEELAAQIAR